MKVKPAWLPERVGDRPRYEFSRADGTPVCRECGHDRPAHGAGKCVPYVES